MAWNSLFDVAFPLGADGCKMFGDGRGLHGVSAV